MIPGSDHGRVAGVIRKISSKPVFTYTAIGLDSGDGKVEFRIFEGEDSPLTILTTSNEFLVFKISGDLRN
jgi:hypothetical protein